MLGFLQTSMALGEAGVDVRQGLGGVSGTEAAVVLEAVWGEKGA